MGRIRPESVFFAEPWHDAVEKCYFRVRTHRETLRRLIGPVPECRTSRRARKSGTGEGCLVGTVRVETID